MIIVKNIFYMLSYAFQVLKEDQYKTLGEEEFDNVGDLFSAIFLIGVSSLVKKGLFKNYVAKEEDIKTVKGKINIAKSISSNSFNKNSVICNFDEYTENVYLNKILKTTLYQMLMCPIRNDLAKGLKKLCPYFDNVDIIRDKISWPHNYNRINKNYELLITICYLFLKGLLISENGNKKMRSFVDEQKMCRLYEKFILEYYKKEYPIIKTSAMQIPWQLDDDNSSMLPIMQTDITLNYGNKFLIIDAKYYETSLQYKYDKPKIHSNNLYQIFTYVKNKEYELKDINHKVSGMLLYAKTDENVFPNNTYNMSGNSISVRTLDLNKDFCFIKEDLNYIANSFLCK